MSHPDRFAVFSAEQLPPKMREASDEVLVRYIQGDSEEDSAGALAAVYINNCKDVWRYIRSKVASDDQADEVFSRVWVYVLQNILQFEWKGKPIKHWLFSVAWRMVYEFWREPDHHSYEEMADGHDKGLHEAADYIVSKLDTIDEAKLIENPSLQTRKKADELLGRAIKSCLNKKQSQIINLIYYEDLDATEIGRRLNMKPGTVRVNHKRALEKLYKHEELALAFSEDGESGMRGQEC